MALQPQPYASYGNEWVCVCIICDFQWRQRNDQSTGRSKQKTFNLTTLILQEVDQSRRLGASNAWRESLASFRLKSTPPPSPPNLNKTKTLFTWLTQDLWRVCITSASNGTLSSSSSDARQRHRAPLQWRWCLHVNGKSFSVNPNSSIGLSFL